MKIPITKPLFDKSEERAIINVLRSGWVTQGPKVAEFEEAFCKFTGAKYSVAVTSATTALFLSLYALGIGPGDEVIVPSLSYIATANVVLHVGAKVVFVDIDSDTFNIDPKKVEQAITKRTKAVIPVHQIGLPFDKTAIYALAKKHKLHIIEDAACALGSQYKGKKIGSEGENVCFSFHPRKAITTGDGGMITTSSKSVAEKLKILRHHGMSVSDVKRHKSKQIIKESYEVVGFNLRMTDLQAAVGIEQLKKLPKILKARMRLAQRYTKAFQKSKFIKPPFVPKGYVHDWQSYMVRLSPESKITREKLMQKLLNLGIATRFGVMASHLEPVYVKMLGKISLPTTEQVNKETIILPLYPQMSLKEQDYVIERISKLTNG